MRGDAPKDVVPPHTARWASSRLFFAVSSTAIALVMGVVCAGTFSRFPVFDQATDVVMAADSSDYIRLIVGSRWLALFDESSGDVLSGEERRKVVHHILYFPVTEVLIRMSMGVAAPFGGVGRRGALFAANAVLTALNVIIFSVLLHRLGRGRSIAFVLLYACSLSTWVYGALPDTWVLSGTLALLVLLMVVVGVPATIVSAAVGLFMLNTFTLGCALLTLVPRFVRESTTVCQFALRVAMAIGTTLLVWIGTLQALGSIQPLFGVQNFLWLTIDFGQNISQRWSLLSPVRWGFAFVQMFILSVISNQEFLNFGGLTIVRTLANVPFGTAGVLLYVTLLAIAAYRIGRELPRATTRGAMRSFLSEEHFGFALFILAFYASKTAGAALDAVLYSPVVLPAFTLWLARHVDTTSPTTRTVSWAAGILIAINSTAQVLWFRALIGAL